jgi:hypothetical protein
MNFDQVMQLRAEVETFPRPAVKDYVCTMTKSYVAPFGGRMVTTYFTVQRSTISCILFVTLLEVMLMIFCLSSL